MTLHPINVSNLTLLEAAEFINLQLIDIRALGGTEIFTNEAINGYLEKLGTCHAALNSSLKVIGKNKETIRIESQDYKRDEALNYLYKSVAAYAFSGDAEQREASWNLKSFFAAYRKLARLNYATESQGIDNLLNDLGNSEYEPMVELIGIEHCITRLQTANDAFKMLCNGPNQEAAQKEMFNAQVLKKQMLAVYSSFAEDLQTMARRKNCPALFTSMLKVLNHNRKYYADLLARRKGVAAETV